MSGRNSILGLSEPNKSRTAWYFYTYEHLKFHAQLSWAWKKFYNLGPSLHKTRGTVSSSVILDDVDGRSIPKYDMNLAL